MSTPLDCNAPVADCMLATCSAAGVCGEKTAAAGALCKDDTRVCDASGSCGDLALGQPCVVESANCDSALCVDGVCCDTDCKEPCMSCNLFRTPGHCEAQPLGGDLKKACGPSRCNGLGQCGGEHVHSHHFFSNFQSEDGVMALAVSGSNNVALADFSNHAITFGNDTVGEFFPAGASFFAARLDPSLAPMWAVSDESTEEPDSHRALAVAISDLGEVFVAGDTNGQVTLAGQLLGTATSDSDIFLAKYEPNKTAKWGKVFGDTAEQNVFDLSLSKDGKTLVMVGTFSGTLELDGAPPLIAAGVQSAIFIAAFNTGDGTAKWARQFSSGQTDAATAVAQTASGAVYVTGVIRGPIDFDMLHVPPFGDTDGFVLRLGGEDGKPQSVTHFGAAGGPIVVPSSIAVTPDGQIAVAGVFSGDQVQFGSKKLNDLGYMDIFLAKLDSGLDVVHAAHFGHSGKSQPPDHQVAIGMAGDIVLAGSFVGNVDFGTGPVVNAGGSDVYVAKFNTELGPGWNRGFGDDEDDVLTGVDVDFDGNIVLAGNFIGTISFGGLLQIGEDENDIFVAKLGP